MTATPRLALAPEPDDHSAQLDKPVDPNYQPNLVLGVLEPNVINILVGASHIGKWRFLLPELNKYIETGKFIEHFDGLDAPLSIGIITKQRSPDSFRGIIREMQLPALTVQKLPICRPPNFSKTIPECWAELPNKPKLLIIQTIQNFLPSGRVNEYDEVVKFYWELQQFTQEKKITILATSPAAKQKIGEGYERACDRVLGSVAWSSMAGTTMLIDYAEGGNEFSAKRRVTVTLKGGAAFRYYYEFDPSSRLIPSIPPKNWRQRLLDQLEKIELGQPFRTSVITSWADTNEIPASSKKIWISEVLEEGLIEQIRRGFYRRPK